jgi:hypothetical protein
MTDEWKDTPEPGEVEMPAVDMSTPHGQPGLYFYGVTRARGWRGFERRNKDVRRMRYRDIEAIVSPTAFELPADAEAGVAAHQKMIEAEMRRATVLPAPFGIIFNGRRALIRFLQEQYLVFDEGLALLEGNWELRLHISASAVGEAADDLGDEAHRIYGELRRFARAAVPFPTDDKRIMSAAFLVDRTSWVEFIERIEDFGTQQKNLTFDVTGPWPAYDFVRVVT